MVSPLLGLLFNFLSLILNEFLNLEKNIWSSSYLDKKKKSILLERFSEVTAFVVVASELCTESSLPFFPL
jgi:hypothetical protein